MPLLKSADENRGSFSKKAVKMAVIAIVAVTTIAIVIVLLPTLFNSGKQTGQTSNLSKVIVTSYDCRTELSELDYVAWVDVSVHNSGGAGQVRVWVKVRQGSDQWSKSQLIHLESQESRDVTLFFPEVVMSTTEKIYYGAWVTPA